MNASYLVNPSINSDLSICVEDKTYVLTIGANDYVTKLEDSVRNAGNIQNELKNLCGNIQAVVVRDANFKIKSVCKFMKELEYAETNKNTLILARILQLFDYSIYECIQ